MINIDTYIQQLTEQLQQHFAGRLLYVGLQGSYLRGEATENSDIDIMAVIDGLTVADLDAYRAIIEGLPHYAKSCGFICSKADLAQWNPLEICHLLHSTKDCFGCLRELAPAYTEQDVRNFVKFSINGLYHEICHRRIHAAAADNISALPFTYKGVFFILQNLHYLRSGHFAVTKAELLPLLSGPDRAVLQRALELKDAADYDYEDCYQLLFDWCQQALQTL